MKYVKPAFEDLLTRLQTDYIDLGMIHYIDAQDEWNAVQDSEYLCYVKELKESGKIHHIGVSNFSAEQIKEATQYSCIEVIQDQYSMIYRKEEDKIVPCIVELLMIDVFCI